MGSQCNVDVGTTYSRRRLNVGGRRIKIGRPSATASALRWPLHRPRRRHDIGTTSASTLFCIGSTSARRRPRKSSGGHPLALHWPPEQYRWHCIGGQCSAAEMPFGECSRSCGCDRPKDTEHSPGTCVYAISLQYKIMKHVYFCYKIHNCAVS